MQSHLISWSDQVPLMKFDLHSLTSVNLHAQIHRSSLNDQVMQTTFTYSLAEQAFNQAQILNLHLELDVRAAFQWNDGIQRFNSTFFHEVASSSC